MGLGWLVIGNDASALNAITRGADDCRRRSHELRRSELVGVDVLEMFTKPYLQNDETSCPWILVRRCDSKLTDDDESVQDVSLMEKKKKEKKKKGYGDSFEHL